MAKPEKERRETNYAEVSLEGLIELWKEIH